MPRQNSKSAFLLVVSIVISAAGCSTSRETPFWSRLGGGSEPDKFVKAKQDLKNPAAVHLSYAKLSEHLGNLVDARESYEFVLDEQPNSVEAILGLARIDQLAGRHSAAETGFRRALAMAPNDPQVLDNAGQYFASVENWNQSIELLNRAALAAPGDPEIRYHLAVAQATSGDIAGAMPHFVKTVGEAQAHYNIGLILHKQGRLPESEREFAIAVEQRPDLEAAQIWLEDTRQQIAARTGKPADALPSTDHMAGRVQIQGERQQIIQSQHTQTGNLQAPDPKWRTAVQSAGHTATRSWNARQSALPQSDADMKPSESSANGSEASNSSMTPLQLEQMRNQKRAMGNTVQGR